MPSLQLTFDRSPRFVLLFVSIIAELMIAPLFVRSDYGLHVAQVLTSFVLVAALWAAGARPSSVLLFAPAIVTHLLSVYWGGAALRLAALTLRVLFFSYATGLIVWRILRRADVTLDTIAGAACAYTLLAVIWGNLYIILEFLRPGSFQIPPGWQSGAGGSSTALAYFSFITLTTVGYGDIVPLGPGAGGLAAAEAIVGQLYLAITIARLVGLHTSQKP